MGDPREVSKPEAENLGLEDVRCRIGLGERDSRCPICWERIESNVVTVTHSNATSRNIFCKLL
jgi:hypothetical protein